SCWSCRCCRSDSTSSRNSPPASAGPAASAAPAPASGSGGPIAARRRRLAPGRSRSDAAAAATARTRRLLRQRLQSLRVRPLRRGDGTLRARLARVAGASSRGFARRIRRLSRRWPSGAGQRLELLRVGNEGTNTFGQLLGRHCVLVEGEAELALVEALALYRFLPGSGRIEATRQRLLVGGKLGQQLGTDRQKVTTGQGADLPNVAKARAHHLGLVAELLEIVVDAPHRSDAGIVLAGVVAALALPVPVVDAADEGGDERHAGVRAGHRLGEREQQGQVAVDPLALESLGRPDAFPG